jgi:hypothetical protein
VSAAIENGPPAQEGDNSSGAVDERPPHGEVDAGPGQGTAGDGFCPLNVQRYTGTAEVGSEHDLGVEKGDERIEVTLPRRREECLDDLPLGG